MATLVIKNIGKIVSGDIDHPVLEGSVIVINENLIEAIGGEELLSNIGDATVVVAIGTTVTLVDATGKTAEFTIVGTTETNSLEHKISNESPAGQALIGHGEGEEVEFVTPTGKAKKYTITAITR